MQTLLQAFIRGVCRIVVRGEAVYKRHESHGGESARKTKALAARTVQGFLVSTP